MSTKNDSLASLLSTLQTLITDPKKGLGQELFYFISQLTPMINVDLLIQNEKRETLLVWREDRFYNGWHIAGGVIRFKELATARIQAVAQSELGTRVEHDPSPMEIHEKIAPDRDTRGHFISMLYRCRLLAPLEESRRCRDLSTPQAGEWAWHSGCPVNIIPQHEVYRRHFES